MLRLFFFRSVSARYLPSFPTRRSSDLWFGGASLHRRVRSRIVQYGSGIHPLTLPDFASLRSLSTDMRDAGRDFSELELVGEVTRSEEHTSELQSRFDLVCRLLLEKKKN